MGHKTLYDSVYYLTSRRSRRPTIGAPRDRRSAARRERSRDDGAGAAQSRGPTYMIYGIQLVVRVERKVENLHTVNMAFVTLTKMLWATFKAAERYSSGRSTK